jgi:hypothetical protein
MRPKLLLLVPGTVFWALVILAVATGTPAIWVAAGVVGVATALGFASYSLMSWSKKRGVNKRVWADGIPATARVVSAHSNGSLNNHPYVDLTLEVTVPGQPPRSVALRQLISQLMVGRIEPDKEIDVKVDRDNPDVVVLDETLTPYGYS